MASKFRSGRAVMILYGDTYLSTISEKIALSQKTVIAVAFWGQEAETKLGLMDSAGEPLVKAPREIRIICNLTMGGTNPYVIKKLKDAGYDILHSPRLHAKVYRFDGAAIIGSANASANGLNFEGSELNGWQEVGVLIEEKDELQQLDGHLNNIIKDSQSISDDDLKFARERWLSKRDMRPPLSNARVPTLWDLMIQQPDSFVDKEIYLVCNRGDLDEEGLKVQEEVINRYGEKFDIHQNWSNCSRPLVSGQFGGVIAAW